MNSVVSCSTNATTVTSSLAASLMDIQNANIHSSETSSGTSTTTISNSNQTLFIHHSQQHQQHFATTLTSKLAPSQQQAIHHQQQQSAPPQQQQQQHPAHPSQALQPPQQQIPQHIVHHGGGPGHKAGPVQTHVNGHPPPNAPPVQIKYEPQQQQQPTPQQQQQQHHVQRQQHPHHHHGHFYQQETLDMSHEDIQQTLSANMGANIDTTGDLEPMSPSADDVFVNLDAFDILADLSEDLDHHHDGGLMMGVGDKNTIVDINPEWAYSEVSAYTFQ